MECKGNATHKFSKENQASWHKQNNNSQFEYNDWQDAAQKLLLIAKDVKEDLFNSVKYLFGVSDENEYFCSPANFVTLFRNLKTSIESSEGDDASKNFENSLKESFAKYIRSDQEDYTYSLEDGIYFEQFLIMCGYDDQKIGAMHQTFVATGSTDCTKFLALSTTHIQDDINEVKTLGES